MAEVAWGALVRGLRAALVGEGAFGDAVYLDVPPPDAPLPCAVIRFAGGTRTARGAELGALVQCVAADMPTAVEGAAAIDAALHDGGVQERDVVSAGPEWMLTTITGGALNSGHEPLMGARAAVWVGAVYRCVLERQG